MLAVFVDDLLKRECKSTHFCTGTKFFYKKNRRVKNPPISAILKAFIVKIRLLTLLR